MKTHVFVDIGNTNVSWKINDKVNTIVNHKFTFKFFDENSIIWVSKVSNDELEHFNRNIFFAESQPQYKELINSYTDSKSLGVDRWLSMIACYEQNIGKDFIVIDIGTAVTIDLIDRFGRHQGGLIFPGLEKIRGTFKFNHFRDEVKIADLGRSTIEAWSSGTLELLTSGLNDIVSKLTKKSPYATIYLTGGGSMRIKEFLNFPFISKKHLVIDGLEFYAKYMR